MPIIPGTVTAQELLRRQREMQPMPEGYVPPTVKAPTLTKGDIQARLDVPPDKLDRTIAILGAVSTALHPQDYAIMDRVKAARAELDARIKRGPTKDATNNTILWQQTAEQDHRFRNLPERDKQALRTRYFEKHIKPNAKDAEELKTLSKQFETNAARDFFKYALSELTFGAVDNPAEKREQAVQKEQQRFYDAAVRGEQYRPAMGAPPVDWKAGVFGSTTGAMIPMIAGGVLAKAGGKAIQLGAKTTNLGTKLGLGVKQAAFAGRQAEKLLHTIGAFTLPETGKVITGKASPRDLLTSTAMGYFGFTPKSILVGSTAAGVVAGLAGSPEPGKKFTGVPIIDQVLPTIAQTIAVRYTGERLPFLRAETRAKAYQKAVYGTRTVKDVNLLDTKRHLDRVLKYNPQLELKLALGVEPTNYSDIYKIGQLADRVTTASQQEKADLAPTREMNEIYLHKDRVTHEEIVARAQSLNRPDLIEVENAAYQKLLETAEKGRYSEFQVEQENYLRSTTQRYIDLGVTQAQTPLGKPGNIYLSSRGTLHLETLLEKESHGESYEILSRIYAHPPNVDLNKIRYLSTIKPKNQDYSELAAFLSEDLVGPGRTFSEAELIRTGMSKNTLANMVQTLIDMEAFEFLPSLTKGRPKAVLQVAPKPTVNFRTYPGIGSEGKTKTVLEYQEGVATRVIPDWFEKEYTNIENSSLPIEAKRTQQQILSAKLEEFYRTSGDLLESDVKIQETYLKSTIYPFREDPSRLMTNAEARVAAGVDTTTMRDYILDLYERNLEITTGDKLAAYNRTQAALNSMDLESFTPQDSPESIRFRMSQGELATFPKELFGLDNAEVFGKEGKGAGFSITEGPPPPSKPTLAVIPTGPGALDIAELMQKKGVQGRIVVKTSADVPTMEIYVEKVQGKPKQGYVLASINAINQLPEAGYFTKHWPAEVVITASDNKYLVTKDRKTGKPLIRDKATAGKGNRPGSLGRVLTYNEVKDILTTNQGVLIDIVYPDGSARVVDLTTKAVKHKTAKQMKQLATDAPTVPDLTPHIKTAPDAESTNSNRIRKAPPTDGVVPATKPPTGEINFKGTYSDLVAFSRELGKAKTPKELRELIEKKGWNKRGGTAGFFYPGDVPFKSRVHLKNEPLPTDDPITRQQKELWRESLREASPEYKATLLDLWNKEQNKKGTSAGFFYPQVPEKFKKAFHRLNPAEWGYLMPKKSVASEIQTKYKVPFFDHMMQLDQGLRIAQSFVQELRKPLLETMEGLRHTDVQGLLPYVLQTDMRARMQIKRQYNLSDKALDLVPNIEKLMHNSLGEFWRKIVGQDYADYAAGETSAELRTWMEKGHLNPEAQDLLDILPNVVYSRARMYLSSALESLTETIEKTRNLPTSGVAQPRTIVTLRPGVQRTTMEGEKQLYMSRDVLEKPEHWLPVDARDYAVGEMVKYKARILWTLSGDRPNAEAFITKLFNDTGVPVDRSLFNKFLPNFLLLSYAGTMPGRLGLIIKQLTQPMVTTYPLVGAANYGRGFKFAVSKEGKALAKELKLDEFHGIPLEHYLAGTESYRAGGMSLGEKAALDLRKAYNIGMYPFNRMEYVNRRTSAGIGYTTIKHWAPEFLKGNMSLAEFKRATGLIFLEKATQVDVLKHLVYETKSGEAASVTTANRKAAIEQAAKTAAKHYSDDSHWIYSAGHTAELFTTTPGRFLGQFGTWPSNYLRFLYRGIGSGDFEATKVFVARWIAINAGLTAAGQEVFGIDPRGWLLFGPLQYAGGPGATLFSAMHLASRPGHTGDIGKQLLKQSVTSLIPFYNAARDFSYLVDQELDVPPISDMSQGYLPTFYKRHETTKVRLSRFAGMRPYEK